MYKGKKFSRRTVEEVKADVDAASRIHGDAFTSCFLQDGSSIILPAGKVAEILRYIKEKFPSITRITTYARAKDVLRKSAGDLRMLHEAGLSRIHTGLESGSDRVLELVCKGATAAEMIEAGRRVVESGISLSEYVLLGLGGRALWEEHARETARVLDAVNPDYIRVRTLRIPEGTPLAETAAAGRFERMTDSEIIVEERLFIESLKSATSRLVSDHSLNLLMEINSRMPEDRGKFLAIIDRFLAMPEEDRDLFSLGRRMGMLWGLDDFEDAREALERTAEKLRAQGYKSIDEAVYILMGMMI